MSGFEIVLCSGAAHLKENFSALGFGTHISSMNYDGKRFFPNADLYTRLDRIKNMEEKKVCVVQSGGCSSAFETEDFHVSDRFFELLQVLEILGSPLEVYKEGDRMERRSLVKSSDIIIAYTYLPFSKQDHAYETGEANSAKLAIEVPLRLGAAKVVAVDPHPPLEFKWTQELVAGGKYEMLSMMPQLIERTRELFKLDDPLVLSPPGKKKIKESETMDLKKKRLDSLTVMFEGSMDVKGRDIILADDLILSGSTLIRTREKLLEMGADEVVCCAPHTLPLISGEGKLHNLLEKLDGKLVVSNTVATEVFSNSGNVVDVTDLVSDWLKSE
jgi:phosphoribosylpyrophosphate synthetase